MFSQNPGSRAAPLPTQHSTPDTHSPVEHALQDNYPKSPPWTQATQSHSPRITATQLRTVIKREWRPRVNPGIPAPNHATHDRQPDPHHTPFDLQIRTLHPALDDNRPPLVGREQQRKIRNVI